MTATYILRVDAGGQYGFGHAVRMMALADSLAGMGKRVTFATKGDGLFGVVRSSEFPVDWYSEDESEAFIFSRYLNDSTSHRVVFVVDIPYIDSDVLCFFRKKSSCCSIVRVDHPWAQHDTADLLVIPNAHYTPEELQVMVDEFGSEYLLCGFDYTMINRNISKMRKPKYRQRSMNTVAFMSGGTDHGNILERLWGMTRDLASMFGQSLNCVWFCGEGSDHSYIPESPCNDIVVNISSRYTIAEAMIEPSLLVCPFGVTAYEALYLGLPVLTFTRNQADVSRADHLEEITMGAVQNLGLFLSLHREQLCGVICDLMHDYTFRSNVSYLGSRLIDGNGAYRVASELVSRFG